MEPLIVFISYSHTDTELCQKLETHLAVLKREGVIDLWYDRRILPGTEWEREIDRHLEEAQIILLLVSSDFIASDYCYKIEFRRASERHEAGEARVIPIILRACYWERTPLGQLQVLPNEGIAITSCNNEDEAFLNVVHGIDAVCQELTNPQEPTQELAQILSRIVINEVEQDQRYDGQLAYLEINCYNQGRTVQTSTIDLVLNITFGEAEEIIPLENNEKAQIRFGIKRGYLCLALENGNMPLGQRGLRSDPQEEWEVGTVGTSQTPIWTFASKNKEAILKGSRIDQRLGTVNLQGQSGIIEAIFKAGMFVKDFGITAQEGLYDENENILKKDAKCKAFFKNIVMPEIEDYLIKVVLRYDSEIIS